MRTLPTNALRICKGNIFLKLEYLNAFSQQCLPKVAIKEKAATNSGLDRILRPGKSAIISA